MSIHQQTTNRMIEALRKRGLTVIDMRGMLPTNARHPYSVLPLSSVKYIVHHWTGDAFSQSFIKNVTGTDYGSNQILPTMSEEDEIDLLRWYANYHISRDGGVWGGIAYGVVVFPSGRIYVNWNIGTKTYHAFRANDVSYAVCCPNANWAAPYPKQLYAISSVWDVLANHTPEIPAGHREVLGHKEMGFVDSRNSGTSCPGTFVAHVQSFRVHNQLLGEAPTPPPAPAVVHPQYLAGLYGTWWVVGDIWDFRQRLGELALPILGVPSSKMFGAPVNGIFRPVQFFERAAVAVYEEGTPDGVPAGHPFRVRVLTPNERYAVKLWAKQAGEIDTRLV